MKRARALGLGCFGVLVALLIFLLGVWAGSRWSRPVGPPSGPEAEIGELPGGGAGGPPDGTLVRPAGSGADGGLRAVRLYELEVETFVRETPAQALVERLAASGYEGRIFRAARSAGSTVLSVRVGRYGSMAEAAAAREAFLESNAFEDLRPVIRHRLGRIDETVARSAS